ncbi:MAG: DUF2267 domain-containing protein [Caldilineaceae bacterium]|nr:DUF2267 domain-containing protein [Caldilineaceae bacterium]
MTTTGFRGFDHTLQETHHWLNEIAEEMGNPDRHLAYHALRGVLFALRDRVTVEEVFNLSAQLPMLMRGIYLEGYKVAGKPEKYHVDEFLARVNREISKVGPANPEKAARAVLKVLDRHVSLGETNDIYYSLPKDIRRLWPALEPA